MNLIFRDDVLAGQRILITGGGTGLGRSMAEAFLRSGASVIIVGRRREVLDKTAQELKALTGSAPEFYSLDIRRAEDVENMIDKLWEVAPITGLVNNAAGNFVSRTEDLSHRAFDAVASTVFHGTFYTTLALGKKWISHKVRGNVVSILVTWVRNGGPYVVPSAMSKAGIDVMTKSLAAEWGQYGIRLNGIAPGLIPTEGMWSRIGAGQSQQDAADANPMRRNGTFEELQNLAIFLISEGACPWLTGETIAMDGAAGQALGGGFYRELMSFSDDDWRNVREKIDVAVKK